MAILSRMRCIVIGVDVAHLQVKLAVNDRNRAKIVWEHVDNLWNYYRIDEIIRPVYRIMRKAGWL